MAATISKSVKHAVTGICAAWLASAMPAQAATLQNGVFASPDIANASFRTYGAGSTAIKGWQIDSGNVDVVSSNLWDASVGTNSIDLSGSTRETLSQTITDLEVGEKYNVFFDLAGNFQGGPAVKSLLVAAGAGASRSYSFDTTGRSARNMGWAQQKYVFLATATTAQLSFQSTSGSCCWGPALDNVSVAPVPLPAGGALLLGALAGGFAFRGRQKGHALA